MSTSGEHHAPLLHVHVASSDVPAAAPARSEAPPASFYTIVLTAAFPVRQMLPLAPNREWALVISADNEVVLCDSQGQAQDTANADSTLAQPQGGLLPANLVVPLRNKNAVWITASVFPSRVTVFAAYKEG